MAKQNGQLRTTHPNLRWVESVARLMDDKFRVPGTNFRFGLDPIMNLIPFLGDLGGFAVSAGLLLTMAKHGASRRLLILMSINIFLDATIGAIPLLGQVFDFYFKANTRNLRLLNEHYQEGKHRGSGTGIIIFVIFILLILFALLIYGLWVTGKWLYNLI